MTRVPKLPNKRLKLTDARKQGRIVLPRPRIFSPNSCTSCAIRIAT